MFYQIFFAILFSLAICKPQHWNLGIGIGDGIGIGFDVAKAIISCSVMPINPKLIMVVTQNERTPPAKFCDISIKWSREKSKIFYFHFHKVQGPQTQQGSNQNDKTPPSMSCDTSITPSGDNYPVGSVHFFYVQLKLSSENKDISNDYDNTENVYLV